MLSPNWAPRPAGVPITALVLHYTGMQSAQAALQRLCDPEAQVSAHYLIGEDGSIDQLVQEDCVAWHAGRSAWRAMNGLNVHSIGIEIVNPGHEWGYREFPQSQIEVVIRLVRKLMDRYAIPNVNLVGHSDIAPARKEDPGELFPWAFLAEHGLGIWPRPRACDISKVEARVLLASIGYRFDQADTTEIDIINAFQRRYRPSRIDGCLDHETMTLIAGLAALIDQA